MALRATQWIGCAEQKAVGSARQHGLVVETRAGFSGHPVRCRRTGRSDGRFQLRRPV